MTNQIKSLLIVIAFGFFLLSPALVAAKQTATDSARQAKQEMVAAKKLDLRKTNAEKEIDRRVASLTALLEKIGLLKRLTEDQKADLTVQIQNEITSLQNLKGELAAETDPEALKTLKQEIVKSYRIYALFMPKITIIVHADMILNLTDMMKTKTTEESALLKLNNAATKAQAAIASVWPLTPEGYPENKTVLNGARDSLPPIQNGVELSQAFYPKKVAFVLK